MERMVFVAVLAAASWLAGCAGPWDYPISREKAGSDDPVLSMTMPLLPETLWPG